MGNDRRFEFRRVSLDNGLILLLSENRQIPLVSVNAFAIAGADQNPLEQPGLALLTSRLIDEGTERFSGEEISELVEDVGGSLSTYSQRELTGLSLQLGTSYLDLGLDLVEQMICHPSFPEDRFRLERRKVLSHLRSIKDDPSAVASNLFNSLIYPESPLQYPVLGTVDSVKRLAVGDLQCFHRQKYAPQNLIVVIVGDFETRRVIEGVQRRFGDWRNSAFIRTSAGVLKRQDRPLSAGRTMKKEQVNILLGHLGIPRRHPDYYVLQVMDIILGSGPGFTSRIPRRLRDELGLAYQTYSDISSSSGLYPGRFAAFISTSPENRQKALDGLLFEIENLLKNGVTSDEVDVAADYLTGNFVFEFQSNAHIARFLLLSELFDLGPDYLEAYPRIIRRITPEQVTEVARLYLDTVNYTTVIVGPEDGRRQKLRNRRTKPPTVEKE